MVAYYSVLIPDARLPLMRALVVDDKLELVHGDDKFKDLAITLKGIYAIDIQASCCRTLLETEESKIIVTA